MKLYTRRGDDGETDLFGGLRTTKDALRIEVIGAVDELNALIGLATAACDGPAEGAIRPVLVGLQSRLFELGADLAAPASDPEGGGAEPTTLPRIGGQQTDEVERQIDAACAELPPMKHFVLPGGTELAARLHHARTVCRRAERLAVALSRKEAVTRGVVPYLNRVSDLLFALARQANHVAGVADVPWRGQEGSGHGKR